MNSLTKDVTRLGLLQEAGPSTGGVQKSVKTGVANALLAMLKCTAAEAAPWRRKVCQLSQHDAHLICIGKDVVCKKLPAACLPILNSGATALSCENSLAAEQIGVTTSSCLSLRESWLDNQANRGMVCARLHAHMVVAIMLSA